MLYLITLPLLLSFSSLIESFCPTLCTCIFHGGSDGNGIRTVLCNNPDMFDIPNGIPTDTVRLRVEKTAVRRIPARAFSYLPDLFYLRVSYSAVGAIDLAALAGLEALRDLRLDGNLLTSFPWEALQAAPRLHTLSLRNNRLVNVPAEAARCLHNLTYLDISSNKLTTLPSELVDIWLPFSGATRALRSTQKVVLGLQDNPWFCDCRISKLIDLSRITATSLVLLDHYLICSGPENLAGLPFQLAELAQCLKPSVVTSTAQIISPLGSNVLLRCDATGYPTPTLTWTRSEGSPINTTVIQETPGDGIRWSIMSLNGVLYRDAGEYFCRAKNVAGMSEASITLIVVGVITTTVAQQQLAKVAGLEAGVGSQAWAEYTLVTSPTTITSTTTIMSVDVLWTTRKEPVLLRGQQRGPSDVELLHKVHQGGTDQKSPIERNKKAGNSQKATIKNIQVVEETSNSALLLWSTDGLKRAVPLAVVYFPYAEKEKQTITTEVGVEKLTLEGLKPETKYIACLVTDSQSRKNQCIMFSTLKASIVERPWWVFAVAASIAGSLLLPLVTLLCKSMPVLCSRGGGPKEDDLSGDTYMSFETLSLKQRTLGSQVGELWTRRQTLESERMLLCSRSSSDSQMTFKSNSIGSEYAC
ncbi:leucine-rich repeat, immunoglobulin-like domain and transmembrane domain-containing protein 3b [Scleropages formosus]|uniref:leucine-rich repeat, immunoglobulin-like domain and transmembrane domain-containing protein 3b n=1 Tax=Scleropages formosus TaxID=113540 RepID=UPI000F385AB3|nr:leucine-rich repeat, immunoglobulin-like domain and transmembrane domain-containing protein 3 [Scleropages formosus]